MAAVSRDAGDAESGLRLEAESRAAADATGERWQEIYRLRRA
jgi:hypothetical protein